MKLLELYVSPFICVIFFSIDLVTEVSHLKGIRLHRSIALPMPNAKSYILYDTSSYVSNLGYTIAAKTV